MFKRDLLKTQLANLLLFPVDYIDMLMYYIDINKAISQELEQDSPISRKQRLLLEQSASRKKGLK